MKHFRKLKDATIKIFWGNDEIVPMQLIRLKNDFTGHTHCVYWKLCCLANKIKMWESHLFWSSTVWYPEYLDTSTTFSRFRFCLLVANSTDIDQTAPWEQSDRGLHRLLRLFRPILRVIKHKFIKHSF